MTTSFIGGVNSENISDQVIHGVNTTLGKTSVTDVVVLASGLQNSKDSSQKVLTSSLTLIDSAEPVSQHNQEINHQASPPSGYATDGSPTFGDGQFDNSTTWADDNEVASKGEFTISRPSGYDQHDYDSLAS